MRGKIRVMHYVCLALIAITTLVSVLPVFTQSREITEAELKKLTTEAAEKRKVIQHREKKSTTGYEPGDSSETLYEFGPNDTYRYKSIRRANGVETKTETIRIGDVRYTRQHDGRWIKEPRQDKSSGGGGIGGGRGTSPGASPEIATEYRYVGSEKIRDQVTAHYRKTRIIKFASPPPLTRRVVDDYWFRADGMLVKESHEDTFVNSNRSYKSIAEYEYDKEIEITAPIEH
jgi:hypothetical protein